MHNERLPVSVSLSGQPGNSQGGTVWTIPDTSVEIKVGRGAAVETGAAMPIGFAAISIDGALIAQVLLRNPPISLIVSDLKPGQHKLTAAYPGDRNYAPANVSMDFIVRPTAEAASIAQE